MLAYGWPFKGPYAITCPFGKKGTAWKCGYHSGLDLVSMAAGGDGVVYPIAAGTVLRTHWSEAYGVYVSVQHPDGYISLYAHLMSYLVQEGQIITRDTVLGYEGTSGNVTGRHLHLEIHKGEYVYPATIDPAKFISDRLEVNPVSEYCKMPTMHSIVIPPENFKLLVWKKGKRTTEIKNYACFPFQASGTVPVGNVIVDGKIINADHRMSTLWVDGDFTVGFGKIPPSTAKYAVSGFALIVDGERTTLQEVTAEGWDTSPLYPSSHSLLGVDWAGNFQYKEFNSTKSGAAACFKEIQDYAAQLGLRWVLMGDGGGSTVVDKDGVNVVASAGNRVLCVIIRY